MATLTRNKPYKTSQVKNLGWLLRNWRRVDRIDMYVNADGTGLMFAQCDTGNVMYEIDWQSARMMLEWINRPVFRTLPASVVVFHAGNRAETCIFAIGDKVSVDYSRIDSRYHIGGDGAAVTHS